MNIDFDRLNHKNTLRYIQIYLAILLLTSVVQSARKELSRCGQRPAFQSSPYRIVGGRYAKPGELPWQVFLVKKQFDPKYDYWPQLLCGGSIIHERWILTAAHCLMKSDNMFKHFDDLHVVSGSFKSMHHPFNDKIEHVQAIQVGAMIKHEKFKKRELTNDIALLRLNEAIKFDNFSQPICLPQPGENFVGKVCRASGWGTEEEGSRRYSAWLKVVNLPIVPLKICYKKYETVKGISGRGYITHTNLCTLYPKGGKDTCRGDSGGPLGCRRNNGQFVQAGITSWGVKCGDRNIPALSTKVSDYFDWIREKTGLDFA